MDRSGCAFKLALRHIIWGLIGVLALLSAGVVAIFLGNLIAAVSWGLVGLWITYAGAILFLYRDPDPISPPGLPKALVAPSHGQVTEITQTLEPAIMPGDCRKISIHVGWSDVQVGKSPAEGIVTCCQEISAPTPRATRNLDGGLLMTIAPREAPRETLGLRFIAGRYPRKTAAWARTGDVIERGQRLTMMQFGSRCELFLPLSAEVQVRAGDTVRGGETIVACFA